MADNSFTVLIPVEENEGAKAAVKSCGIAIKEHCKRQNIQLQSPKLDYIGTQNANSYESAQIKHQKYVIIPSPSQQSLT